MLPNSKWGNLVRIHMQTMLYGMAMSIGLLAILAGVRPGVAAYVDEVMKDNPEFWWRLDEPPGEDFAFSSGSELIKRFHWR